MERTGNVPGGDGATVGFREAMRRFDAVLERVRVKPQGRVHYRRWVERFRGFHRDRGAFDVRQCQTQQVLEFLAFQRDEFRSEEWQLQQAGRAIVLFLRHIFECSDVDQRSVDAWIQSCRDESSANSAVESDAGAGDPVPPLVDRSAPEWYQQVQSALRTAHYAIRTEQAYLDWLDRFVDFHDVADPRELGAREVKAFIEHLAIDRNVAASTQNQAFSALLFAYQKVYEISLGDLSDTERARGDERLPVVLTRDEVNGVLSQLSGKYWLLARLLYGSGLRVLEGCRLRVKDVDFGYEQILLHDTRGNKDLPNNNLPFSFAPHPALSPAGRGYMRKVIVVQVLRTA